MNSFRGHVNLVNINLKKFNTIVTTKSHYKNSLYKVHVDTNLIKIILNYIIYPTISLVSVEMKLNTVALCVSLNYR